MRCCKLRIGATQPRRETQSQHVTGATSITSGSSDAFIQRRLPPHDCTRFQPDTMQLTKHNEGQESANSLAQTHKLHGQHAMSQAPCQPSYHRLTTRHTHNRHCDYASCPSARCCWYALLFPTGILPRASLLKCPPAHNPLLAPCSSPLVHS